MIDQKKTRTGEPVNEEGRGFWDRFSQPEDQVEFLDEDEEEGEEKKHDPVGDRF